MQTAGRGDQEDRPLAAANDGVIMKKLLLTFAFAFTLAALTPGAMGQGSPTTHPSVGAATSAPAPISIPSLTSAPALPADNSGASAVIIVAVVVAVVAAATLVFLRWRRG
jgi:hypothetical protein